MKTLTNGLTVFTLDEYKQIPDDTILETTTGVMFMKHGIPERTSGFYHHTKNGSKYYLNYGIRDIWNHELKNLFLLFKLQE